MFDAEEELRRLWSAAIDGQPVAANDDFFASGGDSLAVAEVLVGLRRRTGVVIDASWLYAHPRFADAVLSLRQTLRTRRLGAADTSCPRVPGRDHPLSAQQRGLLAILDRVGTTHAYQVAYAVAVPERIGFSRLRDAVGHLSVRHSALRTSISSGRQLITDAPAELEGLDAAPGTACDVAAQWAATPIGADSDRLTRFAVVRDHEQTLLVMAAHQLVTDPWSWGVLLRDLAVYCAGGSFGELPVQYSDYAQWQQARNDSAAYDAHLAFWRSMAVGISATGMSLPGASGSAGPAGPAMAVPVQIPAGMADRLRVLAGSLRVSLFHLLLAVFQSALARWSGYADVLVGTATANRHVPDTRTGVGYYVNGRYTRITIGEDAPIAEVAEAVRETWVRGDVHQELHLEPTLFELGLPDLVNVKFSVNAIPTLHPLPRIDGVRLRPVPLPGGGSARRHISVALAPQQCGFSGALTYRTDVLIRSSVMDLLAIFDRKLHEAAGTRTAANGDDPSE